MPLPKRQHSKQRSRKRRTHQKIEIPTSVNLKSRGSQMGVMHRVDPVTGYYKGRQVIEIKTKETEKKK